MKHIDPREVLEHRDRSWFDLLWLDVSRTEFHRSIKVEPMVMQLGELGNADYWFVEYECGLQLGFVFVHLFHGGRVRSTEPNVSHASRHLHEWRSSISELPNEARRLDRASEIGRVASTDPQWDQQACCQVWRQGDDGNPMPVGYPTSDLDANCLKQELESRGHKQIYWVEKL